jgi:hypothetical protein
MILPSDEAIKDQAKAIRSVKARQGLAQMKREWYGYDKHRDESNH